MKSNLRVIKNLNQYTEYCNLHESLILEDDDSNIDTIELLELLIDNYDQKHINPVHLNPVELFRELIREYGKDQIEFAQEIKISPQLISDILNYRRNISKKTALKLADFFALKEESFLKYYDLEKCKIKFNADKKIASKQALEQI